MGRSCSLVSTLVMMTSCLTYLAKSASVEQLLQNRDNLLQPSKLQENQSGSTHLGRTILVTSNSAPGVAFQSLPIASGELSLAKTEPEILRFDLLNAASEGNPRYQNAKRFHEFVGKRSSAGSDIDNSDDVGEDHTDRIKQDALHFLAKALNEKGDDPSSGGLAGKRSYDFVGKRYDFVGKKKRYDFVGKKRYDFVGKKKRYDFVGKRHYDFIGKRYDFVGKRESENAQKRDYHFIGKRAPYEFVGKRNIDYDESDIKVPVYRMFAPSSNWEAQTETGEYIIPDSGIGTVMANKRYTEFLGRR